MNRLQAVRDSIREDYESKLANDQGTNKMKAMEFQIQMRTTSLSAKDLLHQIDSSAPIPHALDIDGKAPLYLCILDVRKLLLLKGLVEDGFCSLYTRPIPLEIDETSYRPDWYVHWNIGGSPTITSHP
jgi:hypothetical protein